MLKCGGHTSEEKYCNSLCGGSKSEENGSVAQTATRNKQAIPRETLRHI